MYFGPAYQFKTMQFIYEAFVTNYLHKKWQAAVIKL